MAELVLPVAAQKSVGMKLEVRNTSGLAQGHAHILLYGKTKAGKTTTAVTMEQDPTQCRIISTQPEEQLAHLAKLNVPYVTVHNYEELNEALRNPRQLFPGTWSTLIVDDLTEGVEFARQYHDGETKDGRQTYKAVGADVRRWLKGLLEGDYNLVATAFERQLQDETNPMMWVGPDLPPSTAGLVTSKFSFILYLTSDRKLLTKADQSARIIAGTRFPKDKLAMLKDKEEPNLCQLWQKYQQAIK